MLITAPAGTLRGYIQDGLGRATGIPYARAARFGRPQPVALSDFGSPYPATSPSPAAPQKIRGAGADIRQSVLVSEDCQNLSVSFPPHAAQGENLPVMVYFHGGSYLVGSGDGARYLPTRLVLDENVVVVSVTYRLGVLGFLGGSEERPANLGLLDAIEALRWIKKNIAAFGGDASNITIFGQSAGGDLCTQLMISDGVAEEALFQRVICQSAPLDLVNHKQKLSAHLLRKTSRVTLETPAEQVGALGWKLVLANPLRFGLYPAMMPFGTQYGHFPLPKFGRQDDAWAAVAPQIEILVGHNHRESAYFLPKPPSALGKVARQVYEALVARGTQDIYRRPAEQFAHRHRAAGGKATTYLLRTGHPLNHLSGAHCTELGLLFANPAWQEDNLLAGLNSDELERQGVALRALWAEFARSGSLRQELAPQARIELG
ncbi:carboxylesterase family protein [Rothia endophytica]|uniref:carboxylesterase family protein n=1 Tax=Rothia endophytica TaxID=1324766 RepID=UPI001F4033DA|nr:carboxylesterase family protein [Rothia endophytica]